MITYPTFKHNGWWERLSQRFPQRFHPSVGWQGTRSSRNHERCSAPRSGRILMFTSSHPWCGFFYPVSARVLLVCYFLSGKKWRGCYFVLWHYGLLLILWRVWLCLGGESIKKVCVCCFLFSNSGKKQLKGWNAIFGWRNWMFWRSVFSKESISRDISMKMRMFAIGEIDVERWLCLKDVEIEI